MEYKHITLEPLAGALGAAVSGVDLGRILDDEVVGEIRRALLDHLVILFRNQNWSVEQHKAFARRFGDLSVNPFIGTLDGHLDVIRIVKDAEDTASFGGSNFHSDEAYFERPAMGTVLYAREVPPVGGDTLFANMYLGYETLSDGMKRTIEGLQAVNSGSHIYGVNAWMEAGNTSMTYIRGKAGDRDVVHPVVRTHPETGRKSLYIDRSFTQRFSSMTRGESRPLIEYLTANATRPEHTCRVGWKVGTVAFFDNRCTQHIAINDYNGYRRVVDRVTVKGDRPV